MDTFKSNKCVAWPTSVGMWWFYGYRYGKSSFIKDNDRELVLCTVRESATEELTIIGNGQFVYKSEVEDAKFIPATMPELPDEE